MYNAAKVEASIGKLIIEGSGHTLESLFCSAQQSSENQNKENN